MTRFELAVALLTLFFPAAIRADNDAAAIVRKAIEAHGGASLLNKYPAARVTSKGSMAIKGQMIPFTATLTYQLPGKLKNVQTIDLDGPRKVAQLFNGDRVRVFIEGTEEKVNDHALPKYRDVAYMQNLYRLTPLLDDKVCRLKLMDDNDVFERRTRGIRINSERYKDVIFFFDKNTHTLVKSQRTGYDSAGAEAPMEEFFSVFRDAKGFIYPSKVNILIRGDKFLESEVTEFLPLEKIDPAEFEKP